MTARNESGQGVAFGLGATLLWGSYPLWYKPLAGLDAYHLLSWRVVFAELFLVALVLLTARVSTLRSTLKTVRPVNVLTVSAVLGLWWLMYIYAIMTGRVLEVAFGYFLSPIMSMLVSRLVFKERLSVLQTWAIFLAVAGVTLMAFELLNLHSFPWIALVIGFCYSFYGLFKKKVPGDPVVIQTLEIAVLLPFAAVFLLLAQAHGVGHQFLQSGTRDLLLVATGLITVLPLWWYSLAAKQLSMIALGFLQFVPPICNFLLAAFVYGEPVSALKLAAFSFIWLALVLFTWNSIRAQRAAAAANVSAQLRTA
ncbi:chloramphenicol-sensitive protein RarD [Pseudomonas sp. NFACC23-1]|uniref:EamA family transporter RarD n=1 Tax=unclassified Pseudomonas TaxID=196821 RepID=UPI00089049D5|nr:MULTISPECIES: EamA family transporter RarD [unclassified Pseudomonas]SDB22284.1 chloramphenicol-sensitive protein RarD [Pseudomonas sp. NFACC17-2]SEJ31059.1 chloramphenicol-sensitive protein RarD [Pseudomonas sp. NFACC23-1]SFW63854.1 chloramphenicol-sensitive protein RarD [Pseudomonas sp. NFACC16-2]